MEDSVIHQTWYQQSLDQLVDSTRLEGDHIYDSETNDGVIEERFRQITAATIRAGLSTGRQPNRNLVESSVSLVGPSVDRNGSWGMGGGAESIEQRGKGCKRKSSCLVAMALEMSSDIRTVQESGGNFYDCNVCLNIAREPILTCCGHLFCWPCFCKLPYTNSSARECPVCEGEVTHSNVIPIYGDGDNTRESNLDSGIMIPPRPKAQRVESVRQQRVAQGVSHIPVAEALRRLRTSINTSMVGENLTEDSSNDGIPLGPNHATLPIGNFPLRRTTRFTRALSETAAALSSVSLALNNAERLVEDLEAYINNRQFQRSVARSLVVNEGNSLVENAVATSSENQILIAEINSPITSPSLNPSDGDHGTQQT